MRKILAVARTEYLNAVKSKAFIAGVIAMPILMTGGIAIRMLTEGNVDIADRRCAIVDPTGELYSVLEKGNVARSEKAIFEWSDGVKGDQSRPRFILEEFVETEENRADVVLSEQVRRGDLFAFLVIDPSVLESGKPPEGKYSLAYHTETPTYSELPDWLGATLNAEILRRRYDDAGIDQKVVVKLNRRIPLTSLGLVEVSAGGEIEEAVEENKLRTFGVPFISLILLFMLVMTSAPALLNQVLEEKMQRISEVLVSAVSPFQLMMGKLVGTVMVSMTLAALYLGAAIYMTYHFEVSHLVPPSIYAWFLLFLTLAMFMYGSIFSAIGAACSEMRDAQSLMFPVMMLVMIPFFCFSVVLDDPTSTFSRVVSLIPIATPMLMMLRIGIPPGPAVWELALAVVLCAGFTVACVWAGGKIFRIGILSQGQAPTIGRMIKWVFSR